MYHGPRKLGQIVHFECFDVFLEKMSGKMQFKYFLNTNNLILVVMLYLIGWINSLNIV